MDKKLPRVKKIGSTPNCHMKITGLGGKCDV